MVLHTKRAHHAERPLPWRERRQGMPRWLAPFIAIEWVWEWLAYALSNWTFIEVLEYLETFSVLVAVIFYFAESGDRIKQRHYQAWQVINTAQGKGGSGGRIEALQELNADKVPLVGVDASSAFLMGLNLKNADLLRSDFSAADLRNSNLSDVNFSLADLSSANFRYATLDRARCVQANLRKADLMGSSMIGVDLAEAALDDADLRNADLKDLQWQHLKSIEGANISGVRNPPPGFAAWALKRGAVDHPDAE